MFSKNGHDIRTLDEWGQFAGPKMDIHWKPKRSAMELARAWSSPSVGIVPNEIRILLDSCAQTAGFKVSRGFPECEVRLDEFLGEPSNLDLLLHGASGTRNVVVGVEAKADEPFGKVADEYSEKAALKNPRSNVPKRMAQIIRGLFGEREATVALRRVRYQLLTGTAATLIAASNDGAQHAIFVIHEFRADQLDARKLLTNQLDFDYFVSALAKTPVTTEEGVLYGPFVSAGFGLIPEGLQFFVGKASRIV